MKKNKILLIPLVLSSLLCLTACNEVTQFVSELLDENAFSYSNKYNPPVSTSEEQIDPNAIVAGGVVAKDVTETPNAYCFKNISYASDESIANTYKTGGVNQNEFNVNNNEDYYGSKSNNNYDLYVPKDLNKNEKHVVVLFIHGGAWISGFKTDVNSYVHEFANKGYITATIKYTLLRKEMDKRELSIFRNLDEIDACIASIKTVLHDDLDFDTTKTNLVIGGASSGAHLAMLYSYSRGQNSAIPISFVVDAVGPVDIKPDNWKRFDNMSTPDYEAALDGGLGYTAIENYRANNQLSPLPVQDGSATYNWNDYQTMRIANGMCGIPNSIESIEATTDENKEDIINPTAPAAESMIKDGGGEDQLSVTYWMNHTSNRFKIVSAYAGKDGVVGIAQYAALENALDTLSITHASYYFRNSGHTDIANDTTVYNQFVDKISEWCAAI